MRGRIEAPRRPVEAERLEDREHRVPLPLDREGAVRERAVDRIRRVLDRGDPLVGELQQQDTACQEDNPFDPAVRGVGPRPSAVRLTGRGTERVAERAISAM